MWPGRMWRAWMRLGRARLSLVWLGRMAAWPGLGGWPGCGPPGWPETPLLIPGEACLSAGAAQVRVAPGY